MWCMLHHLLGHSGHGDAQPRASQEPSPIDILKRRFALGEISREQFEEMVRVLGVSESTSISASNHGHL